jgi:SAM-dependent methyltransferase
MNWMQQRSEDPELLDGDSVSMPDRLSALGQLPLVNRFLGGARAVIKDLEAFDRELPRGRPLQILDIGCGSADIPEAVAAWAGGLDRSVTIVALDRDRAAIELASHRAAGVAHAFQVIRGNGLELPLADRSVDVVTASMFCHHFFGADLVALVREFTRVARSGVIINDLHRHRAAYWGFRVASRIFLCGHIVRHDGEVSVRRGFVPQELWELSNHFPEFRWTVRRRFAFRLCMVGRRQS